MELAELTEQVEVSGAEVEEMVVMAAPVVAVEQSPELGLANLVAEAAVLPVVSLFQQPPFCDVLPFLLSNC